MPDGVIEPVLGEAVPFGHGMSCFPDNVGGLENRVQVSSRAASVYCYFSELVSAARPEAFDEYIRLDYARTLPRAVDVIRS